MKILHYINNLGSGGAEKLLSDILPSMKEKGHHVELLISNGQKNTFVEDEIKKHSIRIINFSTSFYNPIQVFKLILLLRKEKYDVVHAHLFPSQYWLAFASFFKPSKTKLIKTEHSVFNERKNYKILRPLEKIVYSRYKTVIAISSQVKENLASWIDNEAKIHIVENGVNTMQIKELQQLNNGVDYSFIKKENYNILMVGRFDMDKQKDQISLIKALPFLPQNTKLFLAGQGNRRAEVEEVVATLGVNDKVTFLGLRSDVYKLMGLVDLNVLSTNHEGFSGVALESLASGKPFIGSDVVGVNNAVPNDDFLFPKENPKAIAEKINFIISDPSFQNKLVEEGLKHADKCDTRFMVDDYLKLYENLFKK